jgi:predicted transcriptional regulator
MDRMLRAEIVATVRQTVAEVLEGADEVWLSPDEFCKTFGMFSPEWLRRHGELLPREKVRIVMEDGTVKESRSWAYPKHKINRLIREGKLREIRLQ